MSIHVAFGHPHAKIDRYKVDDGRRKPGPKMLEQAMETHDATRHNTLYVGDMDTDQQAAEAAHIAYYHANTFFANPAPTLHTDRN